MRRLLHAFDALVRHAAGVLEFSQHPACILRLQHATLSHDLVLPDLRLPAGAPVILFHLWNERIPSGPMDLRWARDVSHRLVRSFQMVRPYLETEARHPRPQAVGGITVLGPASGGSSDVLARLGFHPIPYRTPWGRFGEAWENAYTWALTWAYNPGSLRGKQLRRWRRTEYWMSTAEFLSRFGGG